MTEPRGPLASPGYWLHHAALAWRRELGTRLKPLALTPTRFDVLAALSHLSKTETAPSQQAIADFAGIDRMMTSKIVSALETDGLLSRAAEGRSNRLSLTESGTILVARATAIARALDAELFDSGPTRAALIQPLSALRQRLGQVAAEPLSPQ
jgi:DNA-binding MarR family transcriptional regulator